MYRYNYHTKNTQFTAENEVNNANWPSHGHRLTLQQERQPLSLSDHSDDWRRTHSMNQDHSNNVWQNIPHANFMQHQPSNSTTRQFHFPDTPTSYSPHQLLQDSPAFRSQNMSPMPEQIEERQNLRTNFPPSTGTINNFNQHKFATPPMIQHAPNYQHVCPPSVPSYSQIPNKRTLPFSTLDYKQDITRIDKEKIVQTPVHVIDKEFSDKKTEESQLPKRKKKDIGCLMISDGQKQMRNIIVTMATLKHQVSFLEDCLTSVNTSEWQAEIVKSENLKKTLIELHKSLGDSDNLIKLEARVNERRKKRERLKKRKLKCFEQKQNDLVERDILDVKIDKWRESVTQKMLNAKQKVDMKKMADKTLSEVRSKISETTKTLDLLKGLQRLRKIRMEAAIRIGRYVPNNSDSVFETKISQSYNILTKQREIYEGEEKTLKVLLEAELEETQGLVKQRKQKIQEQKERIRKKRRNEMLFGKEVEFEGNEPVFPFYQYYNQANQNIQSLLETRHNWDCCIVPEQVPGCSRLPDEWVLPDMPSNSSWTKYLMS